jgi:uncharacterized protein YbjT (DUF2867 family)
MRWVVFGGTGRTGGRIAAEAVARGHAVVVVGRSASPSTVPAGAEAVAGDALDPATVDRGVRGADVVAISLSIPRAGPSPFARVTGPPDLHSRSARLILDAMAAHGVRRVLKVSAQGVGPSAGRAGWGFRALVAASNLGPAFADHALADELVAQSDRDFTIAHPPVLSDAPGGRALVAGEAETTGTFTTVARDDLARWLVDAATDPAWSRRRVTVRPG